MNRLAYASVLLAAACTGGERNQTGDCPADEECSPLTPYGMHFTGVDLVGVPLLAQPKITAIGGTQQIELWKELAGGQIEPLDLPFAAMADNGDALEVVSAGANAVVLGGVGTGADLLRITEPDSDLLYDRYEVEARELDHIDLVPGNQETYEAGRGVAFYPGDIDFGLALYSASGERLADDSLTLTVTGPQPTRSDWDTFSLSAITPGTLTATLTAAGRTGPLAIEVVDAIAEVQPLSDTFPDPIRVGDQGEVCFQGLSSADDAVLGMSWSLVPAGQVTTTISLYSNCVALQVNAAGTFSVMATALGVSTLVQFEAVATAGKPATPGLEPAAPATVPGDARGERARLLGR